jgi:hypothetical protein
MAITDVQPEIWREVTRKMQKTLGLRMTRLRIKATAGRQRILPIRTEFYRSLPCRPLSEGRPYPWYPCNPWLSHFGATEATNVAISIFGAYGCFSEANC